VQGAAAAQTDEETRGRLREEQRTHIDVWVAAYERDRARLGIDPSVDMDTAVLYTWAVELGLGVLESVGIEPRRPGRGLTSRIVWPGVCSCRPIRSGRVRHSGVDCVGGRLLRVSGG